MLLGQSGQEARERSVSFTFWGDISSFHETWCRAFEDLCSFSTDNYFGSKQGDENC